MTPSAQRPELRVLEVFDSLGVGGAEMWLVALLREFRRIDSELPFKLCVDVCLTGGTPSALDDEVRGLGAPIHQIRYQARKLVQFSSRYRQLLRAGRYHVVHDHQGQTAAVRLLIASSMAPPVRVVHFHNTAFMRRAYDPGVARHVFSRASYEVVKRMPTHILGTSNQVLREHGVGQMAESNTITSRALYCGIETGRFRANTDEARECVRREFGFGASDPLLLFVGRLDSHAEPSLNKKNPQFALNVAVECARRRPNVRMVVAGHGIDAHPELREIVRSAGLERSILFVGTRTDVPRLMLAADVLLLPSMGEGLGMAAVEAQAAGLRVLASDRTPREAAIVPNLVTFLSLESGPVVWADEVDRQLQEERPDAAACNKVVQESAFSIEESARRLLEIYATALPSHAVDGI